MKKITLISLRFGRNLRVSPPLGPLSLAASASKIGWEWELHDCQLDTRFNPFGVDELVDLIRQCDSSVIGFSIFNDAIPLLIGACDRLCDELGERRVFVGGPGVVGVPNLLLMRIPQIDAVVVGEGETALVHLLNENNDGQSSGIFRRNNGGVVGAGRTSREKLDDIPTLPWNWCIGRGYSRVPVSTMRGCPFDCSFCEIIAFMGRNVSTRSLDLVLGDMHCAINAIGTNYVDIVDDTFTLSKKRVLEFCRLVKSNFAQIKFSIYSRVDTIDNEMMTALAEAGCERVFFGIDAGGDVLLKEISKRFCEERAEATVYEAARYFSVTASFIWGFPFETAKCFGMTLDMAKRLMNHAARFRIQPQLHLLSPSAGTPLFERFCDQLVFDPYVENLSCGSFSAYHNHPNFKEIEDIVHDNPTLAASFYRYETPEFSRKLDSVNDLNRQLDLDAGRAIVKSLDAYPVE